MALTVRQFLQRRPRWLAAILGVLCGLAAWGLAQTDSMRGLEAWLFDGCFSWRGERPTETRVIVIGIDDESLQSLGKPLIFLSPEVARVLTWTQQQGAKAVGLDFILPAELANFQSPTADQSKPLVEQLQADEVGLAILEAPRVVLSQWISLDKPALPLEEWRATLRSEWQLGFVDTTPDPDGVLRRQQLLINNQGLAVNHFALALCRMARQGEVTWDPEQQLKLGDDTILLDQDQKLRVNYVGPQGSLPTVSFTKVLAAAGGQNSNLPADFFRDAIVILGVTARHQQDYHATPYSNQSFARLFQRPAGLMPGTEYQANVVATIMDRAYIRPIHWPASWWALALVGLVLTVGMNRISFRYACLMVVIHHFGWKIICAVALSYGNYQLEMVGMLWLGLFTLLASLAVRWQSVRGIMSAVKSEAIARALESQAGQLDLQGELRELTVMFTDVRGFTAFSEVHRHEPHRVVELINALCQEIIPLIEQHGGIIDKYIGDGIMVLFGAPVTMPHHAAKAVRAARAVIARVHQRQPRWAEFGMPELRLGIGIHTGQAIVGTIGSKNRLDYTAIGDTVNAAARIESATKDLGTEVLLSAETYAALQQLPTTELTQLGVDPVAQPIQVKGRTGTVVHRLIG